MHSKIDFCRCAVCVLDNNAFDLEFDKHGQCDACRSAFDRKSSEWFPNAEGQHRLDAMTQKLKREGKGKPYDAMIGLSGGIDSAYLAHVAVKVLGLRVLAVHVDAGWNSSFAVKNIGLMVNSLGVDFYTHVVEWTEISDLQRAFLHSGVFNQDIPQDHAFFSTLYDIAYRKNIKYFLSGVNFATECISPRHDGPSYLDDKHIRAISNQFGQKSLRQMRLMNFWWYVVQTKLLQRPKILKPLDFMDYDKENAKLLLKERYGWLEYGEKHSESRFTKFYQDVYLPRKYHFDKRTLHYSSQIVSGQLSRENALEMLNKKQISSHQAAMDTAFVAKKLGMSFDELEQILLAAPVTHAAYANNKALTTWLLNIKHRYLMPT